MPVPDIRGREQSLKVHMRRVPCSDEVDASIIARGTPGFSGADLENIVNEAALFAARGGKRLVEMDEFEKAKDKIMMGTERKSMVMSEKEKRNKKLHETYEAWKTKIADGERIIESLNERFAAWYYVISGDSFDKIHLKRRDLVTKKG